MSCYLSISIGPVQTFVAQARRTRDLWAGSYLLSFLSAHAMCGALDSGAEIVSPKVCNDPLLAWVRGARTDKPPRFGSLPNHFTVKVPDDKSPHQVADASKRAFDEAWRKVCQEVWNEYVAEPAQGRPIVKQIWERQINNFWEFIWVAAEDEKRLGELLARRKLWRTHWLPEEPGDKCVLMPDFQELSGCVRAKEGDKQDRFWSEIYKGAPVSEFAQEKNERLCAIALVKRLFPRVSKNALGWELDTVSWASTADVAAVLWVQKVLEEIPGEAKKYADLIQNCAPKSAVTGGAARLLEGAFLEESFAKMDSYWFHLAYVDNKNLLPLESDKEDNRKEIKRLLKKIVEQVGEPPIYFAMLLADGDRLGELIHKLGGDVISRALAKFTVEAPEIIRRHQGATVYAGGDDLLALLPLEKALACADEIRKAYDKAFADLVSNESGGKPTLSASVVLAHARSPLKLILSEAHRLLDNVAKDGNGRDSIAVSIFRQHTPAAEWVSTWERVDENGCPYRAVDCFNGIVQRISSNSFTSDAPLHKAFLHNLSETVRELFGMPIHKIGHYARLPSHKAPNGSMLFEGFNLEGFVRAHLERASERSLGTTPDMDSQDLARMITKILRRSKRCEWDQKKCSEWIGLDGLTIAMFVAGGGKEAEHWP